MDTFFVIKIETTDEIFELGPYLNLTEASILMVDYLDRVIGPYVGEKFVHCKVMLDECCVDSDGNWFIVSTRLVEVR